LANEVVGEHKLRKQVQKNISHDFGKIPHQNHKATMRLLPDGEPMFSHWNFNCWLHETFYCHTQKSGEEESTETENNSFGLNTYIIKIELLLLLQASGLSLLVIREDIQRLLYLLLG